MSNPGTKNPDAEIEEIMDEINNLEKDLDTTSSETPAVSSVSDFHSAEGDAAMEDVLSDIKADEDKGQSNVLSGPFHGGSTGAGEDGALSITLTGQMKLKLNYEFGGQAVSVSFHDGYLWVQLSSGAEFKIPLQQAA